MIINNNSPAKITKKLSNNELQKIKKYLKKRVNNWIKRNLSKPFTLRDLVGKENANWNGTPLQILYDKNSHLANEEKQYKQAAKDAGNLLKQVVEKHSSNFSLQTKYCNIYTLIQ